MAHEQGPVREDVSRTEIKIKVRGIALSRGRVLVQKPTGGPDQCYAFIGGSYESGETLIERLNQEFEEETNARVIDSNYLFVVERQGRAADGRLVQALEHFFEVTLDREDIESREAHLAQYWLPISSLRSYDLRPWIVRDVIAEGRTYSVRYLVERLEEDSHVEPGGC